MYCANLRVYWFSIAAITNDHKLCGLCEVPRVVTVIETESRMAVPMLGVGGGELPSNGDRVSVFHGEKNYEAG